MSEEFVNRTEFNILKDEVNEIKKDVAESSRILTTIDKKIDVIDAKMITAKEIDDLKLTPLQKRVETLEESHKWLRRTLFTTIGGGIIAIITEVIIYVVKIM